MYDNKEQQTQRGVVCARPPEAKVPQVTAAIEAAEGKLEQTKADLLRR
jgi:hypothetical protein